MSQTKYKLDNNRRGIVIRLCRLYSEYIKYPDEWHRGIVRVIDDNKFLIGKDIKSDEIQRRLRNAIWSSTCDAKDYPYEVWDLPTISRNDFYERKRKFIYSIADNIGI
ncbi:MAG: hypothetical protein HFE51_07940 [Clostridia bacterium]|nr:hypothetical protein [Clostridia bacterium]NDO20338.1 hypothetical protein [Lachnospiraceae bacterium MD329]